MVNLLAVSTLSRPCSPTARSRSCSRRLLLQSELATIFIAPPRSSCSSLTLLLPRSPPPSPPPRAPSETRRTAPPAEASRRTTAHRRRSHSARRTSSLRAHQLRKLDAQRKRVQLGDNVLQREAARHADSWLTFSYASCSGSSSSHSVDVADLARTRLARAEVDRLLVDQWSNDMLTDWRMLSERRMSPRPSLTSAARPSGVEGEPLLRP
jgi:hypothetical protein